jgi:hypothetical protein
MPISRSEEFTVTQTHGLAQSRTCFRTDNEPIFRYRRPSLQPESGAQFTRILTRTNPRYAIQKTGVNSGSGHADHQGAPAAIPFLRSPDPLKKINQRTHFSPCGRHARARGANSQNTAQCQFAMLSPRRVPVVSAYGQNKWLCPGQPAYERSRRRPGAPAGQSNPAEPA